MQDPTLFLKELPHCFPQRLHQFTFPPTVSEGSLFSTPSWRHPCCSSLLKPHSQRGHDILLAPPFHYGPNPSPPPRPRPPSSPACITVSVSAHYSPFLPSCSSSIHFQPTTNFKKILLKSSVRSSNPDSESYSELSSSPKTFQFTKNKSQSLW